VEDKKNLRRPIRGGQQLLFEEDLLDNSEVIAVKKTKRGIDYLNLMTTNGCSANWPTKFSTDKGVGGSPVGFLSRRWNYMFFFFFFFFFVVLFLFFFLFLLFLFFCFFLWTKERIPRGTEHSWSSGERLAGTPQRRKKKEGTMNGIREMKRGGFNGSIPFMGKEL